MDQFLPFLPYELRELVIKECSKRRCYNLLSLNSQLYHELLPRLYHKFSITVDPALDPSDRSKVLLFDDPNCVLFTDSVHIQEPEVFKGKRIHFHYFQSVDIQILPVHSGAELVRAWYQVTRLLDWMLPQCQYRWDFQKLWPGPPIAANNMYLQLPEVQIRFVETGVRSWRQTETEKSQTIAPARKQQMLRSTIWEERSTPGIGPMFGVPANSDVEILLLPFRRIRHARKVTVELPWRHHEIDCIPKNEALYTLAAAVKEDGIKTTSFGLTRSYHGLDDHDHQVEEDAWHLYMEFFLDFALGEGADQLRLERVANWCGEYERFMHGKCHGSRGFGGAQYFDDASPLRRLSVDSAMHERSQTQNLFWRGQSDKMPPLSEWKAAFPQGSPARSPQAVQAHVLNWSQPSYDYQIFHSNMFGNGFGCQHCSQMAVYRKHAYTCTQSATPSDELFDSDSDWLPLDSQSAMTSGECLDFDSDSDPDSAWLPLEAFLYPESPPSP